MKEKVVRKIIECRVCKNTKLKKIFVFGPTPLANAFLTKDQIDKEEYYYPLDVYLCDTCSFLQLGHIVSPQILFGNYVYVSSTSKIFIKHFKDFARDIFKRFVRDKHSLIIDIGSNDGILLKPFKALGVNVLGIEPAENIAKKAHAEGITTVSEFFSVGLAKRLAKQYGKARVVTATNVFAHIDDLDEVIEGLKILLDKDGVFIIEAPYLIDFLKKNYFDLVYHEHLSYWSVKTLQTIFKRFSMRVFDVQKVQVHGGSIRVFVCHNEAKYQQTNNIKKFLALEKKARLTEHSTYQKYASKVLQNKVNLLRLLTNLKSKGKSIAGYGAPAKGNTLLNYFGIGTDILDFIVDDSPYKQNLYTPGKRIPVLASKELTKRKPDYLLILAWNFAGSIMQMTEQYKKEGGRYIIPVPTPKII